MEAMKIEKERKDEARREALRIANEERKKLKAQAAQLRAQERDIERQQFRQMLVCSSNPIVVWTKLICNSLLVQFVFANVHGLCSH